ncbi:hypothetical protein [Halalkalibacter alkalisediminis]|uniref:GP-PDE domain-containing protein n=1 Tax=Halalkalibacter alkalisediminis TaxID=935616 RepID=A0ABV6NNX3_9BACI|nr:hypothetical protein [Halalkalibacter alkalisediminis]
MRKKSKKKTVLIVLGVLFVIWITLNFLRREVKPFSHGEDPLIIAYQGGEHLAPSSTLAAFE